MNKSWIALIVVAVITMLAVMGFEFYNSFSGSNVDFTPKFTDTSIPNDLGTKQLKFIDSLSQVITITDSQLNPVVAPTPTFNNVDTGTGTPGIPQTTP
jgi:hypothetical protein